MGWIRDAIEVYMALQGPAAKPEAASEQPVTFEVGKTYSLLINDKPEDFKVTRIRADAEGEIRIHFETYYRRDSMPAQTFKYFYLAATNAIDLKCVTL